MKHAFDSRASVLAGLLALSLTACLSSISSLPPASFGDFGLLQSTSAQKPVYTSSQGIGLYAGESPADNTIVKAGKQTWNFMLGNTTKADIQLGSFVRQTQTSAGQGVLGGPATVAVNQTLKAGQTRVFSIDLNIPQNLVAAGATEKYNLLDKNGNVIFKGLSKALKPWPAIPLSFGDQLKNVQISPPSSTPSTSNTAKEGWSSVTKYKYTPSKFESSVIAAALGKVGQFSGQSTTVGASWLTDISGGDGTRIREAYKICEKGYSTSLTATQKSTLLANMAAKLDMAIDKNGSVSAWLPATEKELAQRIYDAYASSRKVPSSDEEVLQALKIQQQCLEAIIRLAKGISGGAPPNYKDASGLASIEALPGRGYYNPSLPHAAIIVDVEYDKSGTVKRLKLVEANAASGAWSNPSGQRPWERTFSTRIVEYSAANGYKVVKLGS